MKTTRVVDSINGLLQFNNNIFIESFVPQGPKRNEVYSLNLVGENYISATEVMLILGQTLL